MCHQLIVSKGGCPAVTHLHTSATTISPTVRLPPLFAAELLQDTHSEEDITAIFANSLFPVLKSACVHVVKFMLYSGLELITLRSRALLTALSATWHLLQPAVACELCSHALRQGLKQSAADSAGDTLVCCIMLCCHDT